MKKIFVIFGLILFGCQQESPPDRRKAESSIESNSPKPVAPTTPKTGELAEWWVEHAGNYSQECVWAEQTRWFETSDRPVDEKCRKKWSAHVKKVDHKVPMAVREAVWLAAWKLSKKNEKPFAKGRVAKYIAAKPLWNPQSALQLLSTVLDRSPSSVDAKHAIWAVSGRPAFKPVLKKIANGNGDNKEEAKRYLAGKP